VLEHFGQIPGLFREKCFDENIRLEAFGLFVRDFTLLCE